MTAPRILEHSLTPATPADLPPLHRILTPDEFHQSQLLSPEALAQPGMFPLLATIPKPTAPTVRPDATATPQASAPAQPEMSARAPDAGPTIGPDMSNAGLPRMGPIQTAVWNTANYEDRFVQSFLYDAIHKPMKAAAEAAIATNPEASVIAGGVSAIKQSGEGNNAGAALTALATVPFLAAPLGAGARGYLSKVGEAWNEMHAFAPEMAQAKTIMRSVGGRTAASYEQAAFKLDEFRRILNPLPDQQKYDLIDAIETGRYRPVDATAGIYGAGKAIPFEPSDGPEKVVSAASRTENGRIFVAPTHGEAINFAEHDPTVQFSPADESAHGFLTNKGRFVSREEALNIAENAAPEGQFNVNSQAAREEGQLDASHVTPTLKATGEFKTAHMVEYDRAENEFKRGIGADDLNPVVPGIDPAWHPFIEQIRSTLDDARQRIQDLGTGKLSHFIEDYFPHIWDDPDKAGEVLKSIASRAPLEGPASFLKERSIPTTKEGLAMGLTPASTNPVDLTLLKLREMQKYWGAHQTLNELNEAGLVKYVRAGDVIPDGHAAINDKIATVFGPREGAVSLPEGANIAPEDVTVFGRRELGKYYAPEPVAGLINNYLAPGLPQTLQNAFPGPTGKAMAMTFNAYKGLGNWMNQMQLGFSAFHLGFTSVDAATSRTALGIEYLAGGHPLEGFKRILTAPAAAIPGIADGMNHLFGGDSQLGLGAKIRAAYLNPESASPAMKDLANAVQEAGGRIAQDSFYKTSAIDDFMQAFHARDPVGAAKNSLGALLELSAKPIMEHIVPLQKLQVFGEMAQKVLSDLPGDASLTERRSALQNAWDSVDNRMGQLVYDNLFWNRTFKDLAMASTRSVGWNLGTIRELGGGLADYGKSLAADPTAELSHRAAYVAALPLTVGTLGAAYQYLRTGQGPQELKDYFFPRTGDTDADGNPDRVQLPSYMKDMFAYAGHPVETVTHKMSPLPSTIAEMLSNQDFYGDEIRNPHDPLVKQFQQEANFVGKTVLPFGVRNMMEQKSRGDDAATRISSMFGVTPAKREDVRTPAENRIHDYQKERGSGGATPEMVEARQDRSTILAGLRGKSGMPVDDAIAHAIDHGNMVPADLAKLMTKAGMTPDQAAFKTLTLPQQVEVIKLSNDNEKAKLMPLLAKRIEKMSQ